MFSVKLPAVTIAYTFRLRPLKAIPLNRDSHWILHGTTIFRAIFTDWFDRFLVLHLYTFDDVYKISNVSYCLLGILYITVYS